MVTAERGETGDKGKTGAIQSPSRRVVLRAGPGMAARRVERGITAIATCTPSGHGDMFYAEPSAQAGVLDCGDN